MTRCPTCCWTWSIWWPLVPTTLQGTWNTGSLCTDHRAQTYGAKINKITRAQKKGVPIAETTHTHTDAHTYLVIPKSDTFTSLLFEIRQFLAACRHRGRQLSRDRKTIWWGKSHHLSNYQVSVDEVGALQVGHSLADVHTHAQQHVLRQSALPGSQVVGETAILHELKHQAQGRTLAAHAVELNHLVVGEPPVKVRSVQVSVINQHDRNELWTAFTSSLWPPPAVRLPTYTLLWSFSPPLSSSSIDLPIQAQTDHCQSLDPGSIHGGPVPSDLQNRSQVVIMVTVMTQVFMHNTNWPTRSALMLFKVRLRYRNHFTAPYLRKNQKLAGRKLH